MSVSTILSGTPASLPEPPLPTDPTFTSVTCAQVNTTAIQGAVGPGAGPLDFIADGGFLMTTPLTFTLRPESGVVFAEPGIPATSQSFVCQSDTVTYGNVPFHFRSCGGNDGNDVEGTLRIVSDYNAGDITLARSGVVGSDSEQVLSTHLGLLAPTRVGTFTGTGAPQSIACTAVTSFSRFLISIVGFTGAVPAGPMPAPVAVGTPGVGFTTTATAGVIYSYLVLG